MMNFPTPSYVGQQYSNGTTLYQWDGTGWNIVPQMGPIFIGDAPPANPAVGQEWWRSTNGQLYIWFVDAGGGAGQWVQSAGGTEQAASFIKRTIITANTTTFQFDPLASFADIEVLGAGGAGGGSTGSSGAGLASCGAGGGGGGYAKKVIQITSAIRSATKTITIGAGGSNATATGGDGGNTSYSDGVNALTGNGGLGGSNTGGFTGIVACVPGTQGGTATGGDINVSGQRSEPSTAYGNLGTGQASTSACTPSTGAGSPYGCGGLGGVRSGTSSAVNAAGSNGGGYGSGGGGGGAVNNVATNTSSVGGAGAPGLVIITEYRG